MLDGVTSVIVVEASIEGELITLALDVTSVVVIAVEVMKVELCMLELDNAVAAVEPASLMVCVLVVDDAAATAVRPSFEAALGRMIAAFWRIS